MIWRMGKIIAIWIALGLLGLLNHHDAMAQGTVLTYQGKLNQDGVPFTGVAEIAPTLWDAASGGNPVATNNPPSFFVSTSNGMFTASLDFGSAPFTSGDARWLQLGVRTSFGPFTFLVPRQPVAPVPYAVMAGYVAKVGISTNFSGLLAGEVTGNQVSTVVSKVGGQTSALIASGVVAANAASSINTPGTIVKRDGVGNFSAGAITAGSLAATSISGNGEGITSVNCTNLTGTIPLARLSGITSSQLDAATWQFIVNIGNFALSTLPPPSGMVLIPGGSFTMGNTVGDADTWVIGARPVAANVSAFYMDAMPVTWSQWLVVYSFATNGGYIFANGGDGKGPQHPVQMVNWFDAVKWCNARSEQAGRLPVYYADVGFTVVYRTGNIPPYANWTANGYRLPTEAEWEKGARGGLSGLRFPWGNTICSTNANYISRAGVYAYDLGPPGTNLVGLLDGYPYTSPVGSFPPNAFGLYDMAGNVYEWCWCWYAPSYLGGTDPRGPATGTNRVLRGGGWGDYADYCRIAYRRDWDPGSGFSGSGFRCVLPPGQ